ncbi:MAG: isocitrate/isopropylmalate family dehydrogenase, partial [Myxococcota bacterium]|nr:isocitrate/isopropylmalate family dehydrogenase [Myxococcota bacterium]
NAPSINRAPDCVVFTPGPGDPPDLVGTGRANPLPLLLSSLYVLEHLGEDDARRRLGSAMERAVIDGVLPLDLGGEASCQGYVDAVAARL